MLSPFTPHPKLGTLSTQLYLVQRGLESVVVLFYSFLLTFTSGLETKKDKGNLFEFIVGHNYVDIS